VDSGVALIQAQIIHNPAAVVIPTPDSICLQGLHQLAHLMALPQQLVKVVHRQHQHLIHSSDSHQKLMQVTDPQALDQIMAPLPQQAPDQIMAPLPQQAPDQIMAPDPQQVTQVHSDEASLTSQLHRLMVLRDPQQIMLMEVALKHLRYSVVSSPHQQKMMHRVQEHKDQRAEHKVRELEHSRDQAHQ
jgi:hypothetical protein